MQLFTFLDKFPNVAIFRLSRLLTVQETNRKRFIFSGSKVGIFLAKLFSNPNYNPHL